MAQFQQNCLQGRTCATDEYCSTFSERCEKCEDICDTSTHNYSENDCNRYCPGYAKGSDLRSQLRAMQVKQNVILIIVLVLLILVLLSKGIKLIRWLRRTRCAKRFLTNISSKAERSCKDPVTINMHANDIGRPPSQILSQTVLTPISTRYPAEDNTTTTEYSYDNAALQVTPSSNKPPFPQGAC